MPEFDKINKDSWNQNCNQAQEFYSLLVEIISNKTDIQYATYERLDKVLGCLESCDFEELLSQDSAFITNNNRYPFASHVVPLLNPNVAAICDFPELDNAVQNFNISDILSNPGIYLL